MIRDLIKKRVYDDDYDVLEVLEHNQYFLKVVISMPVE